MTDSITLVDGHVHVHTLTSVPTLLDSAAQHFADVTRGLKSGSGEGVLMLAEMRGARWFESLLEKSSVVGGWTIRAEDRVAATAERGSERLLIVPGRQLVTSEGIEVLASFTAEVFKDGDTLNETLRRAGEAGALLILPWGAGKWIGRRGRLVASALASCAYPVFAGDNGGRPVLWPRPSQFAVSLTRGRAVLPGSDPLPLPDDERRVGSTGFWLHGRLDPVAPSMALLSTILAAGPGELRAYGSGQGIATFIRNQAALRLRPVDA